MFKSFFTAFSNLFKKPQTIDYPATPIVKEKDYRGLIEYGEEECIYCSKCEKACPTGAILYVKTDNPSKNEKNKKGRTTAKKQDMVSVVMFIFEKFDVAVRFAKMIKGLPMPSSQLFKFEGEYFMSMDLSGYDEHELEKMSVIADEYADDIIAGADKRAFLMEHAKVILDDKAIESLAQL